MAAELPEAPRALPEAPPVVVVAGVHSGVGKTSVAVGLMAALRARGLRVQPFKVGPDFLDPLQHEAASGVPSVNLDGWMMGREGCRRAFSRACASSGAQIAVVEGVMGLHDGVDGKSEAGSTAEIAKWLQAPVLLVIDAWCLSRSAAAMVLGYVSFDPSVPFCGVVFNRVAGASHSAWLQEAMVHAPADARRVPLLGCLPKDLAVEVKERHLGLKMPAEDPQHASKLAALAALLEGNLDLKSLLRSLGAEADGACSAGEEAPRRPDAERAPALAPPAVLPPVRVAVARDNAFCFYYEDNLKALQAAGAELVFFSPIADRHLPEDVQALYFGGGYPEVHAAALEANESMRQEVLSFCRSGRFCWAECGGLMYLARRLLAKGEGDAADRQGTSFSMVGLLPFSVRMSKRLVMGYCHARPTASLRRLLRLPRGYALRSQQFHFSEIIQVDGQPAEEVNESGQGQGLRGVALHAYSVCFERPGACWSPEGAVARSTVASYCHVHFGASEGLAAKFLGAARRQLRVASLHPAGTELLCALHSARSRLCAVSSLCDFPPAVVGGLPRSTRSLLDAAELSSQEVEDRVQKLLAEGVTDFHPVDTAWLRHARPDVLLTQDACAKCNATGQGAAAALREVSLEAARAVPSGAASVEEVLRALRLVGAAVGEEEEAEEVVARMRERLRTIEASLEGVARPRVLGLESVCPMVASGQWLPDMRLRAGGADALGDSAGSPARRLEWQQVVDAEADVVVICCCGRSAREAAKEVAEHILDRARLDRLPSLKAVPSRFFVVGHELLSRPGPRLLDGIEQLAALVHEGSFPRAWARDALRLCPPRGAAPDGRAWAADFSFEEVFPARLPLQAVPSAPVRHTWYAPHDFVGCAGPPPRPRPRAAHAAAPGSGDAEELLVYGGAEMAPGGEPAAGCAELWSASLGARGTAARWSRLQCSSVAGESVPTARSGHAMARWADVLLVFGGWSADGGRPLARLELLHLASKCWTHGSTTGTSPAARGNPTLVVDDVGERAVVFGGSDGQSYFGDVHVLDLREWRWERLELPDGPCARTGQAACAWQGRGMLLHGGSSRSGCLDDLWLLVWQGPTSSWHWERLETWPCPSSLSVAPGAEAAAPPARTSHAVGLIEDAVLLVAGGRSQAEEALSDVWLLPMRTRQWLRGPALPAGICQHSLVALRDQIAIWGGFDGQECSGHLWACRQDDLLGVVRDTWVPEVADRACAPTIDAKSVASSADASTADTASSARISVPAWDSSTPLSLQLVKELSCAGDPHASKALADLSRLAAGKQSAATIAMLHRLATLKGYDQYVDPASGYSVFVATYLKRRTCCGFGCRHCPHGHANVSRDPPASVVDDW